MRWAVVLTAIVAGLLLLSFGYQLGVWYVGQLVAR